MKTRGLIYILTTLLTQSCVDHSSIDNTKATQQETITQTLDQVDSSNTKDWCLIEIKKIFPQWADSCLVLEIAKPLYSNVQFILCTHSDGVSMATYLFTFYKNKVKDYEILENIPDKDLSSPHAYEYKKIKDINIDKFVVVNYIQSVNDKSVLTKSGEFKNGFDFENVKIKTDSSLTSLTILNDGQIRRDKLK